MEQTVNTFGKALQMDTNPMVQGNETLSNALNATFVTMNGNEVILQNDMGNRRVDNAYLPSGYEPVGIKEYGGVIYLALYNPITNKSQIGSFPSPERDIGNNVEELGGKLDLSFGENGFSFESVPFGTGELNYLINDESLIPLTKDTSLHTGDKFYVWYSDNLINSEIISNFNNTHNNKVKSPKNKLYTLSLGILNSQNEFVDITKSLVRFNDNNKIIEYTNNESDLYKFNDGYFLASDELSDNDKIDYTKSDIDFIQKRLKLNTNTYSYKLVGPLYLKANLNHIENISYSIEGSYDKKNNKGTLTISADVIYNCPDGIKNFDENGDENYEHYETGTPEDSNFPIFDLFLSKGDLDNPNCSYEKTTYDLSLNKYKTSVIKEYNVEFKNVPNVTNVEYRLCVHSGGYNNGKPIYLKNLSQEGTINFENFGSGTMDLLEWKFYNKSNDSKGNITYKFNTYPKPKHKFENLKFLFIECLNDQNEYDEDGNIETFFDNQSYKTIEVGNNITYGNVDINFTNLELTEKTIYNVYIQYDDKGPEGSTPITFPIVQWYLTSDLFNDYYSSYLNFNTIKQYNIKLSIVDKSSFANSIEQYDDSSVSGDLYSQEYEEDYTINNRINFKTEINPNIELKYSNQLPSNITINAENKIYNIEKKENSDSVTINDSEGYFVDKIDEKYAKEINITKSNIITINSSINQFFYANGSNSPENFAIKIPLINFGEYLGNFSDFYAYLHSPWVGVELTDSFDQGSTAIQKATREEINYSWDMADISDYVLSYTNIYDHDGYHLGQTRIINNESVINSAFNAQVSSNQIFSAVGSWDYWSTKDPKSTSKDELISNSRGVFAIWIQYEPKKWALFCQIPFTDWGQPGEGHHENLAGDSNYAIKNDKIANYARQFRYYSNFGTSGRNIQLYHYNTDDTQFYYVKDFIWNVPFKITYGFNAININDSIDSISDNKKRVNFITDESCQETVTKSFTYRSKDQYNNINFLSFINSKREPVINKQINSALINNKINIINLPNSDIDGKCLYTFNNNTLTQVGKSRSNNNIPCFPVEQKTPKYRTQIEENHDPWWRNVLYADYENCKVIKGYSDNYE